MRTALFFALLSLFPLASFAEIDPRAVELFGKSNVYVRVELEKRNGIDMRATVMPQQLIDKFESEGKAVRPSRTGANVGYWAFLKTGDFVTCEIYNNPSLTHMGFGELERLFANAPRAGTKWKLSKILKISGREYSIRMLDADDSVTGGRKGEVEIAVLDDKKKVYYYFGTLLEHG